MAMICEDLTVLELGGGSIAASLCGMILADNGARVIKIEPPRGDRLREQSPSGFLVWGRGKESLVLDLHTGAAQTRFRDLAVSADVIIEAFSPGTAHGWGIDYSVIRETNPQLVYCSITAFGSTGRYSELKGFESVVAAKAGLFTPGYYTGRGSRRDPVFVSAPLASVGAGHLALSGILAALTARELTGRGQLVEATLLQGLHPMDYYGTMRWQYELQHADGDRPISSVIGRPPALYCSKDGRWINSSTTLPHQLRAMIKALELDWIFGDRRFQDTPRFADLATATQYQNLFLDAFRQRNLDEWLPILLADPNIAFEILRTSEEGLLHPQALHNGQVIEVEDPRVGTISEVGPIATFSTTPSIIARPAPALDEHGPLPLPPAVKAGAVNTPLAHPLAGITIVELGYFYAMPFGITMACSFGARVIKVESLSGDPIRTSYGDPEFSAAKVMEGKESVAVNVKSPEGRQVLYRLLERADVFAFGFRPRVAEELGVDYPKVREINPDIIYLHATGYGTSGPYSHRPLYASPASATAGSYHRQAGYWLAPALAAGRSVEEIKGLAQCLQPPVDGDSNAALGVLSALTLAIYHRRRTGQGQFLSTTMLSGNAYAYADDFNHYVGKPKVALLDPGQYGFHALSRVYPAETGWVVVVAPSQSDWEGLVRALDRPDLLDDERFSTPLRRRDNDEKLTALLAALFVRKPAAAWEEVLGRQGVVEVFGGTMSDFTNTNPVIRDCGLVGSVEHPIFGSILRHGVPVKFSDTPGRLEPGCRVGQHTDAVLGEMGYSLQDVASLRSKGVLGAQPDFVSQNNPG